MGAMPTPPGPTPDDPADAAAFGRYAAALDEAVAAAIPGWVERSVAGVLAGQGLDLTDEVRHAARRAGIDAQRDGSARVHDLLCQDVDSQVGNPLAVLRSLVRYPTEVLRAAGARPVDRDEFARRAFPDDAYDISPATFADFDPAVAEPGLMWGAAKAHIHLARRRREGKR